MSQLRKRKALRHAAWLLPFSALWLLGTVQQGPATDAASTTFQHPPAIEITNLD